MIDDRMVVETPDAEFFHRLSTNYSTKDISEYSFDACITVDIAEGVADSYNWEGKYCGDVH